MLGWLSKSEIPERITVCISLPDSEAWQADFLGALYPLTLERNWEEHGTLSAEEMADEWRAVFFDFVNQGGDIVLGNVEAETLRLTSTGESSLSSTDHALQIGADNSANLILDRDEIQARINGASGTLALNPGGGLTTATRVQILSTAEVDLASSTNPFQIGLAAAANLVMDIDEIQARNNGAISPLFLNPHGGTVRVFQPSTTAAVPPIHLKQSDLSEELIRLESTVASGNPINADSLGAYYGRVRVYIEGVGAKWLALYD